MFLVLLKFYFYFSTEEGEINTVTVFLNPVLLRGKFKIKLNKILQWNDPLFSTLICVYGFVVDEQKQELKISYVEKVLFY